ncbi:MAG TPA: STAS domain-containing protein [Acidimicrobiia bacterium]|nr:STAS domain-containing protein [Acidimicrobiia bacterium]
MATANLTMNIREVAEGVRVIDVEGEITAFSDQQITEAHEKAGDGAKAVILNFEGLEYMNSGGIGLLVTTLIRAQRAGHALRAFGLSDHYRQIFTLTRLDEAISIYDDEASAIAG